MLSVIIIEGLIYGITGLGVFITFRILDFPDLTVDGSFPLGAVTLAACMLNGIPAYISFPLVFISGLAAGLVTSVIHSKLKVPGLLAGILTMTMLYSVNIRILSNRSNVSFLKLNTVFDKVQKLASPIMSGNLAIIIFLLLTVIIIKVLIDLFFHTDFGFAMGALGSNPQLIVSYGMNPEIIKGVGICFSNGLVSLSGGLAALYNGFADVQSGTGIVVAGLATVMLGEFLLRSNKIGFLTSRVILGSFLYRGLMFFARIYGWQIGMGPNDLKLLTGLLIILCLIISESPLSRFLRK